jgi:hypothetical protein
MTRRIASLRLLRSPAVHFVALGAVAFVFLRPQEQAAQPGTAGEIVVGDASLGGRSMAEFVEEEILVREALALGLDRGERAVQARLRAVGSFLDLAGQGGAAGAAEQARALDLQRSDPIVRRHLATLMRAYLSRLSPAELPDEADLERFFAAHAAEFSAAARTRLTQVFSSRDRHGRAVEEEAMRLRERLVAAGGPADAPAAAGDPFAHGSRDLVATEAELDRIFGPGFAASVAAVVPGAWSEPIASSYGLHLVWVHDRRPARPPTLDQVRSRVLHRVLVERRARRLAERLAALRDGYRVRSRADR